MTYITSGTIGTQLGETTTTAKFALGERYSGTDGTEWVYVQANGAITQYFSVGIDENFQATVLADAGGAASHLWGAAQVAFDDNDYGWIPVKGTNFLVRVDASCAADVKLYTTGSGGTAGVLRDSAGTGAVALNGAVIVLAASASAGTGGLGLVREVLATVPFFAEA